MANAGKFMFVRKRENGSDKGKKEEMENKRRKYGEGKRSFLLLSPGANPI